MSNPQADAVPLLRAEIRIDLSLIVSQIRSRHLIDTFLFKFVSHSTPLSCHKLGGVEDRLCQGIDVFLLRIDVSKPKSDVLEKPL